MSGREQPHSRQLAKARSRGYLTVRDDPALIEAWTAECQEHSRPLVIVYLVERRLAFLIVQGVDDDVARELQALAAAATEVDQQAALFPVDRERAGTYTFGPLAVGLTQTLAQRVITRTRGMSQILIN